MSSEEDSQLENISGNEFNLERVVPNEERTKFLFQEHAIRYLFASQFVKSKTVLDAACGSGYGSSILMNAGAKKVVGIDNSSEAIEYCNKNYKKEDIEFKIENCEKINLDTMFDIIVSFETIEHLKNQDNFLSGIKRVLKDDGIFIVSTPNKENYPSDNPFHFNEFTESEFKMFLGKYFSNIMMFYQYYPASMGICKPADIMSDLKINFFNTRENKLDDISEKFNLDNADGAFFVAICSNNEIENIENKLYLFRHIIDQTSSPEEHELNHLDELRKLNKKKDENIKNFEIQAISHMDQLRQLNKKKDEDLTKLRHLNKKKDEDLEHLRGIIKKIHESTSWKFLTKLDFLKKDDSLDKDTDS